VHICKFVVTVHLPATNDGNVISMFIEMAQPKPLCTLVVCLQSVLVEGIYLALHEGYKNC